MNSSNKIIMTEIILYFIKQYKVYEKTIKMKFMYNISINRIKNKKLIFFNEFIHNDKKTPHL